MSSCIPTALRNCTKAGRFQAFGCLDRQDADFRKRCACRLLCLSGPFPAPAFGQYLAKREAGMSRSWMVVPLILGLCAPALAQEVGSRDHTVTVTSKVPVIAGKKSTLYVRERGLPDVLRKGAGD